MSDTIGWGLLATAKIARTFAADLRLVPDARVVAVGSRSQENADSFAAEHGDDRVDGGTRAHGSYQALVEDPGVDVVYVASPHALHLEHVRLALEAGKHVLCEKPLAHTVADAEAILDLARQHDRFLMEAMWTACHPVVRALADDLRAGAYGRPRHLHAELGFRVDAPPSDRLLDPALGAGALLDMGVYPLTLAHLLLGEADELQVVADRSGSGIDQDVAVVGRYPGGALLTMNCSLTSWSSRAAALATDRGRLDLADFHHPTNATWVEFADGTNDTVERRDPVPLRGLDDVVGRGYAHEVDEVHRCLRAGLRESPLVPHAQTLTLMRQMEDLLGRVGVRH